MITVKKEKKKNYVPEEPVVLDIKDDEIWTYQVEGLAAPHIKKPYKHYTLKKIVFTLVIIVAVSISCYFSVRTVQKETFEYSNITGETYQLTKFSNNGYITELDIDKVMSVSLDENNHNPETNFKFSKDETKTITSIKEYAFNCDEKLKVINIGAEVTEIESKAFYSCWALECIYVDENNPNYCDIDGVLYNKDKTEVICYPINHDEYLCDKYGFTQYDENGNWAELTVEDPEFEQYKKDVLTYVVPSTVTEIDELAFNYAYLADVYFPEGLKTIETLAFFKSTRLENVYTYKTDDVYEDTHFSSQEPLGEVYLSLPEGLEYIGSDAFSYNQAMSYVYIPSSVTYIGHHAFWDTVYKDEGELRGITAINVAADEASFKDKVELGDQWCPEYDYMLFKKKVDVNYSAQRAELK